jgi:hypothetical protein
MNYTNVMVKPNSLEDCFQELARLASPEHDFSGDVEAVYECERIMALPGYKQLPIDQQAEVTHRREQILQNWQDPLSLHNDDSEQSNDDRLLRFKLNRLMSLCTKQKGKPLPEYNGTQF